MKQWPWEQERKMIHQPTEEMFAARTTATRPLLCELDGSGDFKWLYVLLLHVGPPGCCFCYFVECVFERVRERERMYRWRELCTTDSWRLREWLKKSGVRFYLQWCASKERRKFHMKIHLLLSLDKKSVIEFKCPTRLTREGVNHWVHLMWTPLSKKKHQATLINGILEI